MRIVADTNIWVSGLLWRGMPWKLLCLAETGQVELCLALPMLAELAEVLNYGRIRSRLEQLSITTNDLVAFALRLASLFEASEGDPIVQADPDDNIFLWCATAASAAYVVSGDRHLLDLGTYAGIPIVTVHDFFATEFPDQLEQPPNADPAV